MAGVGVEKTFFDSEDIVVEKCRLKGFVEVVAREICVALKRGERHLDLLAAETVFGLEANGVANNGADKFDNGKGLARNSDIEKAVGDVGAMALTGVEAMECLGAGGVLAAIVPTKFEESGFGGDAGFFGSARPDATDEAGGDGFVDGATNHRVANGGVFLKIAIGDEDFGFLWVAVGVAPTQSFAKNIGNQSDDTARRVGENHVEELVRRVGGVAGWRREAQEKRSVLGLFTYRRGLGYGLRGHRAGS